MAKESEKTQETAQKSGVLSLVIVAIVSIVTGIATPMVAAVFTSSADAPAEHVTVEDQDEPPVFIPFEDVIVNLDSATLTRFLHVKIVLQVRASNQEDVEAKIAAKKQVLKDWLLGYLRDQKLEEIRGATGHNRLRRNIRDQINAMVYEGEHEKIESVLFEEFNVQ